MSKKKPQSSDFDGDFSFLGQAAPQPAAAEPTAEMPVIEPVMKPQVVPKPVAVKPAAPPPPTPPAQVAPQPAAVAPEPTAAAAAKRSRSSVDIPVDFSFPGKAVPQTAAAEPAAEMPVIEPVAKPKVASKPVAVKPAAPPSSPPTPVQPAPHPAAVAPAPPAPAAPPAATTPPAAANKRSRSSVDIPVDFSFLGQAIPQTAAAAPAAEMPVIEPVAKPKVVPQPVAAEPDAPPLSPPTPVQPAPHPAAVAPAPPAPAAPPAATTPPAAANKRSRSSVDIPVDFSFLGQAIPQTAAAAPAAEMPVIEPVAKPKVVPQPVAAEPAAPPLSPPTPVQPAPHPAAVAPAPPAPAAPPAATTPPAAANKRSRSSVDIPVDFSFLGQAIPQTAAAEPAAEMPVIEPVSKSQVVPKPVAVKPAAPPPSPPPSPPRPGQPAPHPAAVAPAPPAPAAPPASTTPPAAANKRSRSSVDIPVDFSFLGQAVRQTAAAEPAAEMPVIEPVSKSQVVPQPVAAEPDAPPLSPPTPAPVAPQPAAVAPEPAMVAALPASTTPPAAASSRSLSSVDTPVDFSFLGQAAPQPAAAESTVEIPVIEPVARPQTAPEPVAAELAAETPANEPITAADAAHSNDLLHSEVEGEESESIRLEADESACSPENDPSHVPELRDSNERSPTSEADEMHKRSGRTGDFSGDFGFLNNVTSPPQQAGEITAPEATESGSAIALVSNVDPTDSEPADPAISSANASVASVVLTASVVGESVTPGGSADSSESASPAEAVDGSSPPPRRGNTISVPAWFPGYTAALTIIVAFLLFTGRIHVSSNHVLESLPDVRPLAPNEFKEVKANYAVPPGHVLALGESRRFGDVRVTPLKVTRESLEFQDFLTGKPAPSLTTPAALKLHLRFENVSRNMAFPPYDAALMSHRFPPFSNDLNTLANSFLAQVTDDDDEFPERLLNYMQSIDNNFVLTGQNAGKVVAPGELLETYVASEPIPDDWNPTGRLRWRVQFRKGVHHETKNGVTTLIDVHFDVADIGS